MFLNRQAIFLIAHKLLIFVLFLIISACSAEINDQSDSLLNSDNSSTTHNVIDSLLNRISKDTLALTNYLTLAESTGDKYAEMATYNTLGRYHLNNYSFLKAIEYHKKYLDIAESSENRLQKIKALNTLAGDYMYIYALDESSEYYFKALSLFSQAVGNNDESIQSEKSATLTGLGLIYLKSDQPDEAISYFKESFSICNRYNYKDCQAVNLLNIGVVFEKKMQYDSAYYYFNKSLDHYIKINSVSGISKCFELIGKLQMAEGELESAMVYLESAYNTLHHTSDRLNWLDACFSLGSLNIITGHFTDAENYLHQGLKVANELNLPNYLERAHLLLSDLHKKEGNAAAALEEHSISDLYGNALRKTRNIHRITNYRVNYEKELNKAELNTLTAHYKNVEKKKQNSINVILISLLFLLGLFIILIQNYRLRIRKKEAVLELEKLKSGFYVNISQEFMTPVNIIIGLAERFKKNLFNKSNNNYLVDLDILSRQSENLYLLIDEISMMAAVQENEKEVNKINGNIIAYFQYLFECFSTLAEAKRIEYTFSCNVSELYMDYVADYLRIIMNNLLSNAIKYSTENGRLSVDVNCNIMNKVCKVEVTDTGVGISEKDLPYIFNMFYQSESERSKQNGSGIGLTLTKKLIEKLQGTIEVKSVVGKGSRFIFTLPIKNEDMIQKEKSITIHHSPLYDTIAAEETQPQQSVNREIPVLLILGENSDMNYFIASVLREKYDVLLDTNGKEAIQTANEKIPDLIVSDVIMSQMSGYDFCKEIKNSGATNHIPVVLLSIINTKKERIEGFRCGADAILPKPIQEDELMVVIDQLLSTRRMIRDKYEQIMTNIDKRNDYNDVKNDANIEFLQRVTDIIYKEIDHADSIIEILASEVCLSSSQLNRKIKAITGMTTSNYILKVRLNKAKKHLIKSQKPIGDIAMECGFSDFAYFSRSFKKEFGMTPTSFQRLPHSVN
jgi:signal transduction histidine kinase/AraC-like DNA-binding protein/CheY-like chemotaxis protein/Tfp pilus assembly protein PilF